MSNARRTESPTVTESKHPVRLRCYQCFRPISACFCDAIPQIDNSTNVLILQHVGERYHAFNTARIVKKALQNCHLIVDHNSRMAAHNIPIHARAALLYPGPDAPLLTELQVDQRPQQLVIIDGTWDQAKTIVRDVPQLRNLPCFRLAPSTPGQYRIRLEPNAHSLSTVEATVAALQALEPETIGLDQLLLAFKRMVDDQIAHAGHLEARRQYIRSQSRPLHFPQSLLLDAENFVVVYGESTPGRKGERSQSPLPVNWLAHRLGTEDRFSCFLRQSQPLTVTSLDHMRLSPADFDNAVSREEFRTQWSRFLRRNDVLIVYHHRTFQLLQHIQAQLTQCLVLKSIFGKWRSGFHSEEELMAIEGLSVRHEYHGSRAARRLDLAVALAEHLRTQYGKLG